MMLLLKDAMIAAEKIFAVAKDKHKQTECCHQLDENICLLCGAFIADAFLGPVAIPGVDTPKDEPYHLPPGVDKSLVASALDMFGCLNTSQIRARKKKIILTACLLYICNGANIEYFYSHFDEFEVTQKEMLYGITAVEELLPADRCARIDLKLHEMLLTLQARGDLTHLTTIRRLHPGLTSCYNKLRVKSILDSCLYLIEPQGKAPSTLEFVKESLFTYTLPKLFVNLFEQPPKGHHSLELEAIQNDTVTVVFSQDHLEIKWRPTADLFNHRNATLYAWKALFTCDFYHPNGSIYNGGLDLHSQLAKFTIDVLTAD